MEQCETEGCSGVVFKQHLCLVCANKLFDTATSSDEVQKQRDSLFRMMEKAMEHINDTELLVSWDKWKKAALEKAQ